MFRPLQGTPLDSNKTVIRGTIYEADGKPIERGPRIRILTSQNVEKLIDVEAGGYEFSEAALAGNLTITAEWYGRGPRTQRVRVARGFTYTLNFGEPGTETECYGLSSVPEIVKVEPGPGSTGVNPSQLTVGIELSEALNSDNINNLVTALRLLPGNATAAGEDRPLPDLSTSGTLDMMVGATATISDFPYEIPMFRWAADDSGKPKVQPFSLFERTTGFTVDGAARAISVSFPLPLLNGGDRAGRYQVVLVGDPDHPIKDVDGNVLGTDATGKIGTQPPKGTVISNAFLSPALSPETFNRTDLNTRWNSTHANGVAFTLAPDKTPPKLQGVAATVPSTGTTKIDFTFDEPLVALGRNGSVSRSTLRDLANYTFAVGLNAEYLGAGVLLSGGKKASAAPVIDLKSSATRFGAKGDPELGKEFRIVADPAAPVTLEVTALNRVTMTIANGNLFDPTNSRAIMARVEGIHDPANNPIPAAQADLKDNQPRGNIAYTAR